MVPAANPTRTVVGPNDAAVRVVIVAIVRIIAAVEMTAMEVGEAIAAMVMEPTVAKAAAMEPTTMESSAMKTATMETATVESTTAMESTTTVAAATTMAAVDLYQPIALGLHCR